MTVASLHRRIAIAFITRRENNRQTSAGRWPTPRA